MSLVVTYNGEEIINYNPGKDEPKWWVTGFDTNIQGASADDLQVVEKGKKMSKKIFFCIIISFILCIAGCGKSEKEEDEKHIENVAIGMYDDRKAAIMMLDIWDAIEKKDKDALKALFAQNALEGIEDCDKKIEEFINAFEGDITTVTSRMARSTKSKRSGKTYYVVIGAYKIETTEDVYIFSFRYVTKDEISLGESGLYRMNLVKESLYREYSGWFAEEPDICVYMEAEE